MSGAGAITCNCCATRCPSEVSCEHCDEYTPGTLTITFTGVTVAASCVDGEESESSFVVNGDPAYLNGTFCVTQSEIDPCQWGYTFDDTLFGQYFSVEEGDCESLPIDGTLEIIAITVCRTATSWIIRVTGLGAGADDATIYFWAEITTADCATGGTASNDLAVGDGSIYMSLDCAATATGLFEMASGGSVTLTPCCE